jgi:hypothetical protein
MAASTLPRKVNVLKSPMSLSALAPVFALSLAQHGVKCWLTNRCPIGRRNGMEAISCIRF